MLHCVLPRHKNHLKATPVYKYIESHILWKSNAKDNSLETPQHKKEGHNTGSGGGISISNMEKGKK